MVDFMVKYQDRIVYGTDSGIGPNENANQAYEETRHKWLRDWRYFNTDEMVTVPELDSPVQGLALPRSVVEKIYRTNIQRVEVVTLGQLLY